VVVPEPIPFERIVGSTSLLARILNVDRATVVRWRNQTPDPMPTHGEPKRGSRADGHAYDLAAVIEWRFRQGLKAGVDRAVKERAAAAPPVPAGGWVHPSTGKVLTDEDVINAEKRRIVADANKAEHQERIAYVKRMEAEAAVVDTEDATASFTYLCKMMYAGFAKAAVTNQKEFEDLGMHPREAVTKAHEPMVLLMQTLMQAKLLDDPTKEPIDEGLEPGGEPGEDAGDDEDEAVPDIFYSRRA
jgi:phage terminase Nu1 subunit (DNA packaging protein)